MPPADRICKNLGRVPAPIGAALRVLQFSIEGLSAAKRAVISRIAQEHNVDVLCLQETPVLATNNIAESYKTYGYDLIIATPSVVFGRATYERSDTADVFSISSSDFSDAVQVGGFKIVNVYKLPSAHWNESVLLIFSHPVMYVGDFNSHHTKWGYTEPDTDGEALYEWATNNNLTLTHDSKKRGTFY